MMPEYPISRHLSATDLSLIVLPGTHSILVSKVWAKTAMANSHTGQIQVMHFKLLKAHGHT